MVLYLDIGVQVVSQVFFMALCNKVEQHSADTDQKQEFYYYSLYLNSDRKHWLTHFLFIVSLFKTQKVLYYQ